MQKWEYKIESLHGFGITEKVEELNKWGSAGWEVCNFISSHREENSLIFKRAIPGEIDKEWESEYSMISRRMKALKKAQDQEKCS